MCGNKTAEEIEITPEMIEAVKRELSRGFGGETENPCVDYEAVAERAIKAACHALD